ncbi:MAG: hypothetical protein FJ222_11245 [Lentisphaerae bacterium]|nr:hypothetical protein [Lentisphaerota bacterium]
MGADIDLMRKIGTRAGRAVAALAFILASAGTAAAGGGDDLRLYVVRSNVFEHLLASVSTGSDFAPVLAFKDFAGTTRFVRVGDRLGEWALVAYEAKSEQVFKASVGSSLTVDTSTVTLRHTNGQERVLVLGAPLEQPGRMACLVSLASGAWGYARAGDAITLDDRLVAVETIDETTARVRTGEDAFDVPLVSDAERDAVMQLWRARQEQAEARIREEAEARRASEAARVAAEHEAARVADARLAVRAQQQQPAHFFYGTEYRYPVAYDAVPCVVRLPDGSTRTQYVVVPTRFETRAVGHRIDLR